jgi:hypothetical protein
MELQCNTCPSHEAKITKVELSRLSYHLKAECKKCGRFIKFVKREELPLNEYIHEQSKSQELF